MIQFVRHDLINKNKWDNAINLSVNAYVYAYSYFLDIVTDNQWDALIIDDYQMVMPLPYRLKFGIKYVYQPKFNQQLGIFYQKNFSNFDIFELLRSIPKNIRFLELNFNKYLFDRIPEKYIAANNINYELEVFDDYTRVYSNYSTNLKRNLKKAESNNLKEINYVSPDELIQLFSTNKGSDLKIYTPDDYLKLKKLIFMLMHKGKAEIKGVTNEMNTVIAAALFVRSNGRKIFLFSGLSEEGKEKGAMPFLIDYQLKTSNENHYILDFEGSNNPDLARFYAGFGATSFQYQRVLINNLPQPLKILKGIYSKFRK